MEKKDNKEEPIYKIICQKYMSNTEKEMLQEEKQKNFTYQTKRK